LFDAFGRKIKDYGKELNLFGFHTKQVVLSGTESGSYQLQFWQEVI
jgi:hypothetical protein